MATVLTILSTFIFCLASVVDALHPTMPPLDRRQVMHFLLLSSSSRSSTKMPVTGTKEAEESAANAATAAAVAAKAIATNEEWKELLTSGQYFVLRQGGTEPPFSSPLVHEARRGVYVCAACVAPLFDSTQKFDSGTGWPSFAASRRNAVDVSPRLSGLLGAEVTCRTCHGHLGDVYYMDGSKFVGTPAEITQRRYCINGAALVFVPLDQDAIYVIGDGLTNRKRLLPLLLLSPPL